MSRLPGRSTKEASREKEKAEEECRERHVRNDIVQEVVAGIEKMAKAQVEDKPIAQRTVGAKCKAKLGPFSIRKTKRRKKMIGKKRGPDGNAMG